MQKAMCHIPKQINAPLLEASPRQSNQYYMLYISSTKEQTRAAIELDDGSLEEARVAIDWRQWNKMKKLRPMTTK